MRASVTSGPGFASGAGFEGSGPRAQPAIARTASKDSIRRMVPPQVVMASAQSAMKPDPCKLLVGLGSRGLHHLPPALVLGAHEPAEIVRALGRERLPEC